jgi:hypothetical protein
VVGEYKDAISQTYGSLDNMVNHYVNLDKMAAQNPVGLIHWFMQQRGITPEQVFGQQRGQSQEQTPVSASDSALLKEIAELKKIVYGQQANSHKQIENQAAQEIEKFSKDPNFPFFKDLKPEIGELLLNGRASNLEEAYHIAMRLNDKTFKHLLEERDKKILKENTAQAQKSRQAATLKTTPTPVGKVAAGSKLDSLIEEAMSGRI